MAAGAAPAAGWLDSSACSLNVSTIAGVVARQRAEGRGQRQRQSSLGARRTSTAVVTVSPRARGGGCCWLRLEGLGATDRTTRIDSRPEVYMYM